MTFTNAKILDCTAAEYFALPQVSRSDLVQALRSPAKFEHWKRNPPSSASMEFGSMVHALLLDPEAFDSEFHIIDLPSRRGNAWKDAVAEAGDRTPVLAKDMSDVYACVDAAESDKDSGPMLKASDHEVTIVATHKRTGLEVKCRVDELGDGFAGDLKTTKDASEEGFARSVHQFRYDIQDAFYGDICAALQGWDIDAAPFPFWFACVETSSPWLTGLWDLIPAWVEAGRAGYEQAIDDYLYHKEKGWPKSYGRGTLSPKPWMIG